MRLQYLEGRVVNKKYFNKIKLLCLLSYLRLLFLKAEILHTRFFL